MISLTFTVDNVDTVLRIYDQIEVIRYTGTDAQPDTPVGDIVSLTDWTAVSGTGSNVPIQLSSGQSQYHAYDALGNASDWYSSRYISSTDSSVYSGWTDPILGEPGDLYYNPLFPPEIDYGTTDQMIIDRIRVLIGDPKGLNREVGEPESASIMDNNRTYHIEEKGWPVSIRMNDKQYTDIGNPTVNGYRYLTFQEDISQPVTISGVTYAVDVWYYTFRNSDRQIMAVYESTPPPAGLTTTTATTEAYILAAAIDIVRGELLLDANEDGALVADEGSKYNPTPGLDTRRKLLDELNKKLKDLVKALTLGGITGVLID